MTTGNTRLVNWLGSSTVCYRRSSRDPLCSLWSSGMNMCCPITPSFFQFLMGSFWPGHGCWQLSTRLGVRTFKREFQRDARRFFLEFTFVLSTVAARSKLGQGLSCFCPAIVIGGYNRAPLHLLGLLVDGLLERGWVKGSEIEACRSEYQSFVQEQRQLERSSTRSRPDIGDVLSFCCSQAGFRARQHLFKVCIMTNVVKFLDRYLENIDLLFQVFQLTALIVRGPVTCRGRFIINLDRVMICKDEVQSAILCVPISRSGASFQTQGLPC